MNTAHASYRTAVRRVPARTGLRSPEIAHPGWPAHPAPQPADQVWPRLHETAPLSLQGRQASHLPVPQHQAYPAPRTAAVTPDSLWLSKRSPPEAIGQRWVRKRRTWPQCAGGILIAVAFVVGAVWYVPRVVHADRQMLTGTVMSSGVVTLNFPDSGEIAAIDVYLGQTVHKGQVLAAEYAPDTESVVTADKAAIASDRARISELKAAEAANPAAASADNAQIAAGNAQLAADEAQLATERAKAAAADIIAPAPGEVVAVNGQPGEVVTAAGVRDYAADSQRTSTTRSPSFSLLPEGPQSVGEPAAGASALPVIALRTSMTWQVVAHIPENAASGIKPGQAVMISVPAAGITNVPGRIDEVLPTPESTSQGIVYQAVVTITGRPARSPLNGMAADIQLSG
jgi:multidrug efflux pump subunit AcrA (membrane-fusion protein)